MRRLVARLSPQLRPAAAAETRARLAASGRPPAVGRFGRRARDRPRARGACADAFFGPRRVGDETYTQSAIGCGSETGPNAWGDGRVTGPPYESAVSRCGGQAGTVPRATCAVD